MSNNCLVTKLKGSVPGGTLPIFGQVEITFLPSASGQVKSINTSQYSIFILTGETNLTIVGNGKFLKGNDQSDLGKNITLPAYSGVSEDGAVIYSDDGTELKLIVNSLYNISTSISASTITSGFPGVENVSSIKGMDSIKFLNLTAFSTNGCSVEYELTDILGSDIKKFYWRNTYNLTGDISEFGKCPLLREIDCLNAYELVGSVESMVENFAASGLADGAEIKCLFNNNEHISFHDISGTSSIPYAGTIYVSRSGSSYLVTQGGATKGTYVVGSGWTYA